MRKSLSLSSFAWLAISFAMVLAFMPKAHAALTFGATTVTTDGALTIDGVATSAYTLGASTTTGTITIGGTAQTGATTFQSVNATGATTSSAFVFSANSVTTGTAAYLVSNALTTGTALGVSSSGVIVTTGELLDLVASGATTSTGVVRITTAALTTGSALTIVGSANTVMTSAGKFLTINDGTNSVFSVGYNGHLASVATDVANGEPLLTAAGGFTATAETAGNATGVATDTRGQVSFTADTDAGTAILTFGSAYAAAPVCVISPANAAAQANMDFAYVTTSTTAMTINYITGTAATADLWNYVCIE